MSRLTLLVLILIASQTAAFAQQADASRGRQAFGACTACHSLEPGRNMTGPSLAGLWGRKAGGLDDFDRYSDALKSSGIIWEDRSLDAWLTDPDRMVPDNDMPFNGIKDGRVRADLLAFLKEATKPGASPQLSAQSPMGGGMGGMMGGMMGGAQAPNLKKLDLAQHVTVITHCRDTYRVTTADGKMHRFWERNLRLKTDSSDEGPQTGTPAILPAGMMGDRADVIFAAPEEISKMIEPRC